MRQPPEPDARRAPSSPAGDASAPARPAMRRQLVGLLLARGLGSLLQAVAVVAVARSVVPATLGLLAAAMSVVGIVLVVTGLGLSLYVPRAHAAGRPGEVAGALRVNTWSNVASAALLAAALATWVGTGAPWGLVLLGPAMALERNVDTLLSVTVAEGDSRPSVSSMLLRRGIALAVLLPALAAGADPVAAYTAGLTAGSAAAQVHARSVLRVVLAQDARPNGVRDVLRGAWPFLLSNLAGQARTVDTAVVAAVAGPATAGLYAAAAKLVQPLVLVPQVLGGMVLPRAARMTRGEARRLVRRLVLASLVGLGAVLPVALVAAPLVTLVMGAEYAAAGPALAWLVLGLPALVLGVTLGAVLQAHGRERRVAAGGLVLAAAGLGGAALGAWWAGPTGAALGLTAGTVLRAVLLLWWVRLLREERNSAPSG